MTSPFVLNTDGADVQAIVRSGFGSAEHCRYVLLQIRDPARVRAWIAKLLAEPALIKTVVDENASKAKESVMLAFSYAGLRASGLTEHAHFPFPTQFRNGMADPKRAPLIGDRSRVGWNWGDVATDQFAGAHVLAAHYRQQPVGSETALLDLSRPDRDGLSIVSVIQTCPYYVRARTEPFGFADGVAQPIVAELMKQDSVDHRKKSGGATFDDDVLPPGEFLLGYVNSYGERSYCPDVIGWPDTARNNGVRFARNGSYLAIRQIEQHVAQFKEFAVAEQERMIGRTVDGWPLVTRPGSLPDPEKDRNDFRYRLGDYDGFQCPRGAHIRRANPRDALGWDVPSGVAASKLHRLIRRGRVYTESSACDARCESAGVGCGKGLFFIALNADLDRQFEFVQQRWVANSKFADLWDEADPMLGDGVGRSFSMPGSLPIGTRLRNLPQFTTVRGGGYFFLPSLSALRFMAGSEMRDESARRAGYMFR